MKRIKSSIALAVLCSMAMGFSQASTISANFAEDVQVSNAASTAINFQLSASDVLNTRGLVLRLHYDSSVLSSVELSSVLAQSHLVSMAPHADLQDYDNDASTDTFILVAWSDTSLSWPGVAEVDLLTISALASDDFVGSTSMTLSEKSYTDLQPELMSTLLFTDFDNDLIRDDYEIDNDMDPTDSADAAMDFDGDTLPNLQEFQFGTNIYSTDSDGDGMTDDYEVSINGLDPLDSSDADTDLDGDGVDNRQENIDGTDPLDASDFILRHVAYDYDGDGIADVAVRRISNKRNYILNSSDNSITRADFGFQDEDIPVTGDFDGDGKADLAVRRPSTYYWYVLNSSGVDTTTGNADGITRKDFGRQAEDIPVPADYDGDGITDFAVRRPSTQYWYILNSSGVDIRTGNDDAISRVEFGLQEEDIPVPADYDGDGKADLAVRRPSNQTWYIRNSSDNQIQRINFGRQSTDVPVPADYDGDGKVDVAVRRPSEQTFYIRRSTDGVIQKITFGLQEADIPIPADYDGDGKADVAVRRPSTFWQYVLNTSDNQIQRIEFGMNEDDIPYAAPVNTRINMVNGSKELLRDAKFSLPETGEVSLEYGDVYITTEPDTNF